MGLGLNSTVEALTVVQGNLYVTGIFSTADGISANGIAEWNGTKWLPAGSGLSGGSVYAIAASTTDLYVGGGFAFAGNKISASAARLILQPGTLLNVTHGVPAPNSTTLTFLGLPNFPYALQFKNDLSASTWQPLSTNYAGNDGFATVQDLTATSKQRFYCLIAP